MNTTSTYRVRTGHGTVHLMSATRSFQFYGRTRTNDPAYASGKAECGALTSAAASLTTDSITCTKCSALVGRV